MFKKVAAADHSKFHGHRYAIVRTRDTFQAPEAVARAFLAPFTPGPPKKRTIAGVLDWRACSAWLPCDKVHNVNTSKYKYETFLKRQAARKADVSRYRHSVVIVGVSVEYELKSGKLSVTMKSDPELD